MLYFCIPVHNEAPTIGVLLWRLRKVFQEFSREYEVLVYDDASTDGTAELLEPYARVLPLTVIRGTQRLGYARSIEELLRAAARRTRYPRRDAIVTLEGDFTDQPEHIPELIRRFEGGADIVVAERPLTAPGMPPAVRRLRRAAPWVLKPFAGVPGVTDAFSTFRLYRVSVIRDTLRETRIAGPHTDGWAANAALLVRAAAHARRIEAVTFEPRYELRMRESRVRPWAEAMAIFHTGRELRRGTKGRAPLEAELEARAAADVAPAERDAEQPVRLEAAAGEATRDRSRRSRRGGARNRARGEGAGEVGEERRPQQPAPAAQPAPRQQQKSQQPKSQQPKPQREQQQREQQPPREQAQGAAPAPVAEGAQAAAGGEAAPAAEGSRPRRRSRGGRSRRRARSGDEGSSPS